MSTILYLFQIFFVLIFQQYMYKKQNFTYQQCCPQIVLAQTVRDAIPVMNQSCPIQSSQQQALQICSSTLQEYPLQHRIRSATLFLSRSEQHTGMLVLIFLLMEIIIITKICLIQVPEPSLLNIHVCKQLLYHCCLFLIFDLTMSPKNLLRINGYNLPLTQDFQ